MRTLTSVAVEVPLAAAERECAGYFELNGSSPNLWAPLSGIYECADGFVRVHANFDHHRDAALRAVGLPAGATKADLGSRLRAWGKCEFETAATHEGGAVAACRSFDEWDALEQASVVRTLPLLTLERIGDADPLPLPETSTIPLDGVRVLDLTRILAGPIGGRTLAAYGADVMLVNAPYLPNIDNLPETSRGKLSCHIDLARSGGKARLDALIDGAHVFVQGYRPGALARRGYGPQAIAERRPGIVCVSLSAYGAGPWEARRGFDSLVQTATGFNLAEAEAFGEDRPRALPYQILDCASGFLMAFAAQAGLIRQQQEGGSWHAQVSLVQTAQWLRAMGRDDGEPGMKKPDFQDFLQSWPCDQGELRALPHAALLDGRPCEWRRPSVSPGTSQPVWP